MINKSKAYLAPLVLKDIPEIPFSHVRNTYIFSDFRCLEPTVYIKLVKEGISEDQLAKIRANKNVDEVFDVGQDYLVTTLLDSAYHFEYLCFKRGNYSWYREESKFAILNYLTLNTKDRTRNVVNTIRRIFAKDSMLRKHREEVLGMRLDEDIELTSRIEERNETVESNQFPIFNPINV